jgi:raffinose/stachyose/melibiose transport system substrate-binding protein
MLKTHRRHALIGFAAGLLTMTVLSGPVMAKSTVTMLIDNGPNTVALAEALVKAFELKNPDITIDIETRPGGGEGDNIVKTRLATGQMTDIFYYNSGSLLQALAPQQTLMDLSQEPFMANVSDSFKQVVSVGDAVFGVPISPAEAGGIFYNRDIYAELGLDVPKTWAEFMANNEKIKAAGKTALIQTYGDPWTSQLFVLADFFNVQKVAPDFATQFTAGVAKFAKTPAATQSFERLKQVHDANIMNEDFGAATYNDGLRMLVNGEGAHYPMLTFAIPALSDNYPELLDKVGFFAQPGDDAANNGLTTWMPGGFYIPQTSANPDLAKQFMAFVASTDGCKVLEDTVGINGPFLIKGCELPEKVAPVVADLLPYFAEGGQNAPALEFLSPVKGPILEQLTVEVGSGIREPADAAARYDEDARKQAQQLGLPGW